MAQDVEVQLNEVGIFPKAEWLRACLQYRTTERAAFRAFPMQQQAQLCIADFLESDMNTAAVGRLPPHLSTLQKGELKGRYVLQVDEAVDMGCPPQNRYKEHPSSCLKLNLTDGEQRAFAMEYRKVPQLSPMMPAGIKIAVDNVFVRRGLLLLCPENVMVLGGQVQHLEEARHRVMERWNQPPRGRRTPLHQGAAPANYRDAAAAVAWPPQADPHPTQSESDAPRGAPPPAAVVRGRGASQPEPAVAVMRTNPNPPQPSFRDAAQDWSQPSAQMSQWQDAESLQGRNAPAPSMRSGQQGAATSLTRRPKRMQPDREPDVTLDEDSSDEEEDERPLRVARTAAAGTRLRAISDDEDEGRAALQARLFRPPGDGSALRSGMEESVAAVRLPGSRGQPESTTRLKTSRASGGSRLSFPSIATPPARSVDVIDLASPGMDVGNDDVVAVAPPHPDPDLPPFSYLTRVLQRKASLPAGGSFRAKIKGTLAGLTLFDFKSGSAFATRVHVDDGSAICECSIASEAVEQLVGHSAPTVSAALKSGADGEKKSMRDTMKRVQHFFTTFEGTMYLEVEENAPWLKVVKLHPGISDEDAWALLRRLQEPG